MPGYLDIAHWLELDDVMTPLEINGKEVTDKGLKKGFVVARITFQFIMLKSIAWPDETLTLYKNDLKKVKFTKHGFKDGKYTWEVTN